MELMAMRLRESGKTAGTAENKIKKAQLLDWSVDLIQNVGGVRLDVAIS